MWVSASFCNRVTKVFVTDWSWARWLCDLTFSYVRKEERTSLLPQHVKVTSHTIDFNNTKDIANIEHVTRKIREVVKKEKLTNNLNILGDTQSLPSI